MPRSYASSRPIYLQVFNTLYTVATLLFQTYWLFWSVPPQLYHHASLHWVSSHGQVIIIILTLLLVVVLIRIHHQIYDIILDHPGVVVVVTDLFLKSKVTSSIDRSGGGCLEMALKYCSLFTTSNIISSRSASLLNLTEWSFKVDFVLPWQLKGITI